MAGIFLQVFLLTSANYFLRLNIKWTQIVCHEKHQNQIKLKEPEFIIFHVREGRTVTLTVKYELFQNLDQMQLYH